MNASDLKPGIIVRGPVLPEPIEVQVYQHVLRPDQIQLLEATPEHEHGEAFSTMTDHIGTTTILEATGG